MEHSSLSGSVGQPTTLMFRHVPRKYTTRDLLSALEQHVSRSALDFVYVPWDRKSTNNMGFAFVNFTDSRYADMISAVMNGTMWPRDTRMRQMMIVPAIVQGFVANILKYRDNVKEPDAGRCPLVFIKGREISLNFAFQLAQNLQMRDMGNFTANPDECRHSPGSDQILRACGSQPHRVEVCRPDGISRVRASCDPLPSLTSGIFPHVDQHHRGCGNRAAEASMQTQANSPPSTSTPGSSAEENLLHLRREAIRKTPGYASAWHQINDMLRKLKQAGAF
eukprot:CAMPEP_0115212620 /NCGR_PEP_ID=MMETSP0270-20121206/23375_1 /TAXON_ID=71861 /ORGANISM="Scrippsiella trochoidea, Strain CCMP3099" /LENGTH=278 /DNA_ID=CAMNT_0002626349 /DNA_START=75 /DNA_END=911 /DNA_ORIENTATION=-